MLKMYVQVQVYQASVTGQIHFQVLKSFQDSNARSHWWPCIQQQCLLNMALCHIRYPGGELRCQDSVSDADLLAAYRCISRLRFPDLLESMDARALCHLIRTEGDLFFREKEFQLAIEKLNEAKRIAVENGFDIDVRYCDERLRIVEAEANKYRGHSFSLQAVTSELPCENDADISDTESSDELLAYPQTSDENLFEAMSNFRMQCTEEEAGSPD